MQNENWLPKGIRSLEPAAWAALKDTSNIGIVAGPGSGKTEFLAQKAAYLLETNQCRNPQRILAISFKKDAANNLAARVTKRCASEHAARFDSLTFEGFAKGFVDRFANALPQTWRLPKKYEIQYFKEQQYRGFLDQLALNYPQHRSTLIGMARGYQHEMFGTYRLGTPGSTGLPEFVAEHWYRALRGRNPDFMMLNRLCEFLIRTQPQLANALRQTYKFIFVDEFQDTTFAQYDLLSTLVQQTAASITAVGDNKQRIMVWAGAKADAFNSYFSDFNAAKYSFLTNYRSTPELVRIQNCMARELEPGFEECVSAAESLIDENTAAIWNFEQPMSEFSYLANWISADRTIRELAEQDYAILVRQKPEDFQAGLSEALAQHGMELCNQAQKCGKTTIQDLLSDAFFQFLSSLIRLCVTKPAPRAWDVAVSTIAELIPAYDDAPQKNTRRLEQLLDRLKPLFASFAGHTEDLSEFLHEVLDFVGQDAVRGTYPEFLNEDNYKIFLDGFLEYAAFTLAKSRSWAEFIDRFEAIGQVPLLTVHKSKGLEYDTVLFIGLDDDSWWSYTPDNPEGNATFFVALSRAKQRVIFTYGKGPHGRRKISELYRLLREAGVPEHAIPG